MSHIGWIPTPTNRRTGRSLWRFFPLGVVIAMGVVVIVNGGMIYAALSSFPGKAGDDEGFALSNHYDAVLDRAQREAALGWIMEARADDAGRPVLILTDRKGAAMSGASVTALAERPLGAAETRSLRFREASAGHYIAGEALPGAGQWELTLSVSADGHDMAATRRVIVR
jgi:nitrogen fixation protein FixH